MGPASYRFAFDIGTNSIGWAVFEGQKPEGEQAGSIDTERLAALGARIFSDGRNPKDGQSLAVMRRVPRGMRRRRDRYLQRQRKLIALLVAHGLMPHNAVDRRNLETLDPLALRALALSKPLSPFEIGRALFHLNQRRGFKSNRKTDGKNKESGVMAEAAKRLAEALTEDGSPTLGAMLHKRQQAGQSARFRVGIQAGKAVYEFYPTRDLIEREFEAIWQSQAAHHPAVLTDGARNAIHGAIFDQRPLKQPKPGRCSLIPDEERLPLALPSVQSRIIFETLNALRYGEGQKFDRSLDKTERNLLAAMLLGGKDLTFPAIRKALKLSSATTFSLEDKGREKIEGSKTAKRLAKDDAFGKRWMQLPISRQEEIVEKLIAEEDEEALIAWLVADAGLDPDRAETVARATLPDGYASLGRTANGLILQELVADVIPYSEAVRRAGEKSDGAFSHHSDQRDGEILSRLPYYGEVIARHVGFGTGEPGEKDKARKHGRIANPTVHIGLNQLTRIVNRLIDRFGHPEEIVVELARDLKQSQKQKDEDQRRNRENQKKNELRRTKLAELGQPENGLNMALLRLWEDQQVGGISRCPYTLRPINIASLFSDAVEIEHILPFSRTLDDSMANRVVCFREANRRKRNRTPFEAFGHEPNWPDIAAHAETLPGNKRWRFREDAMARFEDKERGMLERQLNETRHLAKAAKALLGKICNRGDDGVWVVSGQLTALMRRQWGLDSILGDDNRKNRNDHRHHAIDAATIGCISRSMLNRVAREAGKNEMEGAARIVAGFPEPFEGFRDQVRDQVRSIIVSHKPEHGKGGALHEDTSYGLVRNEREKLIGNLVHRKPLDSLNPNEIDRVRDPDLRAALQQVLFEVSGGSGKPDQKALSAALIAWAKADAERIAARTGKPRNPIRHVRLLKPKANAVEIKDRRTGKPYRAVVPDENWCLDVVSFRDGKGGQVWKAFAASLFEVNQPGWRPLWEREKMGGKLVMRLHKGDLVEIDDKDGVRRVKRVVQLEPSSNRMRLAEHFQSGKLQERNDDVEDTFRWDLATVPLMRERNAAKIALAEDGTKGRTKKK